MTLTVELINGSAPGTATKEFVAGPRTTAQTVDIDGLPSGDLGPYVFSLTINGVAQRLELDASTRAAYTVTTTNDFTRARFKVGGDITLAKGAAIDDYRLEGFADGETLNYNSAHDVVVSMYLDGINNRLVMPIMGQSNAEGRAFLDDGINNPDKEAEWTPQLDPGSAEYMLISRIQTSPYPTVNITHYDDYHDDNKAGLMPSEIMNRDLTDLLDPDDNQPAGESNTQADLYCFGPDGVAGPLLGNLMKVDAEQATAMGLDPVSDLVEGEVYIAKQTWPGASVNQGEGLPVPDQNGTSADRDFSIHQDSTGGGLDEFIEVMTTLLDELAALSAVDGKKIYILRPYIDIGERDSEQRGLDPADGARLVYFRNGYARLIEEFNFRVGISRLGWHIMQTADHLYLTTPVDTLNNVPTIEDYLNEVRGHQASIAAYGGTGNHYLYDRSLSSGVTYNDNAIYGTVQNSQAEIGTVPATRTIVDTSQTFDTSVVGQLVRRTEGADLATRGVTTVQSRPDINTIILTDNIYIDVDDKYSIGSGRGNHMDAEGMYKCAEDYVNSAVLHLRRYLADHEVITESTTIASTGTGFTDSLNRLDRFPVGTTIRVSGWSTDDEAINRDYLVAVQDTAGAIETTPYPDDAVVAGQYISILPRDLDSIPDEIVPNELTAVAGLEGGSKLRSRPIEITAGQYGAGHLPTIYNSNNAWAAYTGNGDATITSSASASWAEAIDGTFSAKRVVFTGNNSNNSGINFVDRYLGSYALEEGETYRVSFYAKTTSTPSPSNEVELRASIRKTSSANGPYPIGNPRYLTAILTEEEQFFFYDFVAQEDQANNDYRYRFGMLPIASDTGYVHLNHCQDFTLRKVRMVKI